MRTTRPASPMAEQMEMALVEYGVLNVNRGPNSNDT